ncbi:hypothetical protein ACLB1G_06355 [Oxalobacteraceae bacterium A2-2]
MAMRPEPRRQRGAALLLLVTVLSLTMASILMATYAGARLDSRRVQRSQRIMGEARDALLGYAVTHGRLPRPAISASDGREQPQACASDADCSGFLPAVTLGVPGNDAWGKRLRYSVSPELTLEQARPQTALANRSVASRDGGGRLFYLAGGAGCSVDQPCLPLVLLSNGARNFGSTDSGIVQGNAGIGNVDEQRNAIATDLFIARPASADAYAPGGEFDDLVLWVPLQQLISRMSVATTLQ